MPYNSDSDVDGYRRRSWSDISELVNEELSNQANSCHGCFLLFMSTAIIIGCYSIMSALNKV